MAALRLAQVRGRRQQLVADFLGSTGGERPTSPGQPDSDGAAVVRVGDQLDQIAALGPVDEAGDARLVELEVTGEGEDPRFAVAQDPSKQEAPR